tara:strand:- start:219 stop:554 length:336 start_codon:yes stop_codon:yes gene_type:complete
MGRLTSECNVIVAITDVIICVETKLTTGDIRNIVGDETEIACIELSETFTNKLLNTKFIKEEQNNFRRFLSLTSVPTTIDEGLDLISERGGVDYLTEREIEALNKLTNKSN